MAVLDSKTLADLLTGPNREAIATRLGIPAPAALA
jgi:hypothetical protein